MSSQPDAVKAGLIRALTPGRFELADRGRDLLASKPERIDISLLESRYPEMVEFRRGPAMAAEDEPLPTFDRTQRSWTLRPAVEARIREKLERVLPNDETRNAALGLLAFAIENADEERPDGWSVRETHHGVAVMAGRLIACKIDRTAQIGVMGPINDDVRATIGADRQEDEEFKWIRLTPPRPRSSATGVGTAGDVTRTAHAPERPAR
jgi:hypothetical protein